MTYFSTVSTVPLWVSKSAQALCGADSGRILVILQQGGGNDGLNTVIPYTDPLYTGDTLRPNLKITEENLALTKLGDDLNAFHPMLIRLRDWWENGNVAIVQNVGYPNPNLSHFTSTDLWEFGRSPSSQNTSIQGWMSRFFDNTCAGAPMEEIDPILMMAAGKSGVPQTLGGSQLFTPPAINRLSRYTFRVPGGALGAVRNTYLRAANNLSGQAAGADFVQRAANSAMASVDDMAVAGALDELNPYPNGRLGRGLDIVSRVIRAGLGGRIFYVSQGGYDTHANQFANNDPVTSGRHPELLDEFDQSVDAFLRDMHATGNLGRVLLLTFSEFGRRVKENGSSGTDHGAANCLFVMGGSVRKGIYGGQPDLGDLIKGNLRHQIDFRAVYAKIIQDWFDSDPEPIFGSADYLDPSFKIREGIAQIPFLNKFAPPVSNLPAASGRGLLAGVALTAVAGAMALRMRGGRDESVSHEP